VRSFVQAPMRVHGRSLGAITLLYAETDRCYRDEDVDLLCDLASRAAVAIENARLYREARRAARVRDELLAMVSHDLRTPLGVIAMNAARMLRRKHDDPGDARGAEAIQRAAGQMTRLIDDLLDIASIEHGKLSIELAPIEVGALLAEIDDMFEQTAADAGVKLQVAAPASPLAIQGDRARLLQIMGNLVGNALKFTSPGGVVDVTAAAEDDQVRFLVADTGPGIDPEAVEHLFEPFWQASADRRGKGLGLYIARGLVAAHGGTMSVDTAPGVGTRISFTVPLLRR
jgi:signal transduction histidine kinase